MSNLCNVGVQLRETAVAADQDFKTSLLEFFASRQQDDERRRRLEALGVEQRETDDAFIRHRRFCRICRETMAGGQRSAVRSA
jgi:hypothetical protein